MENFKSEAGIFRMLSKLAQALTDSNNSDVSTPPHFTGKDDEWETWYSQFRTYLKGKGWLDTFESEGPGTTCHRLQCNNQCKDLQQVNHFMWERVRAYICTECR